MHREEVEGAVLRGAEPGPRVSSCKCSKRRACTGLPPPVNLFSTPVHGQMVAEGRKFHISGIRLSEVLLCSDGSGSTVCLMTNTIVV